MSTVAEAAGTGPANPSKKPPVIIIVAADKGGVGKSTVSRATLCYLAKYRIPVRPFDTEPNLPVLARFHPEAQMLAADTVPGQMQLIDAATTSAVTLVDCKAGLLTPIIKAFRRVRLLDDVKAGKLKLVIMHVVGPTVASTEEVDSVAAGLDGADIIQVNNMTNPNATFPKKRDRQVVITVPNLEEEAAEAVDRAGVSFDAFIDNPKSSRMLTGYVRAWLLDFFTALDDASFASLIRPE